MVCPDRAAGRDPHRPPGHGDRAQRAGPATGSDLGKRNALRMLVESSRSSPIRCPAQISSPIITPATGSKRFWPIPGAVAHAKARFAMMDPNDRALMDGSPAATSRLNKTMNGSTASSMPTDVRYGVRYSVDRRRTDRWNSAA